MSQKDIVFVCLHCSEPFIIREQEFNCRILRHGVYRATMEPMNPHASREECERLVRDNLIYGCGKPLRITNTNALEICEYI
jgi:hypothetical protein